MIRSFHWFSSTCRTYSNCHMGKPRVGAVRELPLQGFVVYANENRCKARQVGWFVWVDPNCPADVMAVVDACCQFATN